jgi:hypothetical protein
MRIETPAKDERSRRHAHAHAQRNDRINALCIRDQQRLHRCRRKAQAVHAVGARADDKVRRQAKHGRVRQQQVVETIIEDNVGDDELH